MEQITEVDEFGYVKKQDIRRPWQVRAETLAYSWDDADNGRMLSEWNTWVDMNITYSPPLEPKSTEKKLKPEAYKFEDYKPYKRKRFQ